MVRAIERGRLADGAKAREADGEGMERECLMS
jgi:hypothetical protein